MQFSFDTTVINVQDGHIRLEWNGEEDATFELQRAPTEDFTHPQTLYRGPDKASFISGLENGTYYFRIRELNADWSDTLTLIVAHQSLKLAFTLFGIGGVVFILTVVVVVHGAMQTRKEEI